MQAGHIYACMLIAGVKKTYSIVIEHNYIDIYVLAVSRNDLLYIDIYTILFK